MQSTLERELNVLETVVMQAYGTCAWLEDWVYLGENFCDIQHLRFVVFGFESDDWPLIL